MLLSVLAVWPTGQAPTVQAQLALSHLSVIFGQTTATADPTTGIAQYQDLYMHAPSSVYWVNFTATSGLVGCPEGAMLMPQLTIALKILHVEAQSCAVVVTRAGHCCLQQCPSRDFLLISSTCIKYIASVEPYQLKHQLLWTADQYMTHNCVQTKRCALLDSQYCPTAPNTMYCLRYQFDTILLAHAARGAVAASPGAGTALPPW